MATIKYFSDPFEYCIAKDSILTNYCTDLFHKCNKTPKDYNRMYVNGMEQHNDGVPNVIMEPGCFSLLHDLIEEIKTKYFNKNLPKGKWSFNIAETNLSDTAPSLDPHTDDPELLYSEGAEYPGYLKFLVYLADDIQYQDYGTKLYTEDNLKFKLNKEIPFKNGVVFVWRTGPNSWHGTDFCTTRKHRRFFICGEYIKNE